MQDIATEVGVSRATVSMALRGDSSISEKTRERIKAVALRLGYAPNPMVSALMTNLRMARPADRGQVLAYVNCIDPQDPAWHPDWSKNRNIRETLEGARKRAAQLGFKLEEFSEISTKGDFQRLSRTLIARGIAGVLVGMSLNVKPLLDNFDWKRFAVVDAGGVLDNKYIFAVRHNHFQGMTLAFEKALEYGHRRIGFYTHEMMESRVRHRWTASYLFNQQKLKVRERIPSLVLRSDEKKSVNQQLTLWIEKHRPTVVIGMPGRSLVEWDAPEELDFVTLGYNADWSKISGVFQRQEAIGAVSVELLASKLYHNEKGLANYRREVVLDGEWVEGSSLRRHQE
jgi:DNA-binding LacI/PurR family transcriptional regulator